MTEMVTKLLEVSRNAFGSWREHEGVWSTRQFEVLSKYLGNKIMLGDTSPELFDVSGSLVFEGFYDNKYCSKYSILNGPFCHF